jgi:hypothetical protein
MKKTLLSLCLALPLSSHALAQSPEYMVEDCTIASQGFFQDFQARSDAKYEGQRTDGTHAVNGTIHLENRSEDYQCSYNAAGDTMVDFYTQGKSWPAFVRGGGSPYAGSAGGSSEQPASGNAARVTFAPGKSGITLGGAIVGKNYFDYSLDARAGQTMKVELRITDTNGDGTISFNILPPGSTGVAIYNGSIDGNSASVRLPESGDYVIRLYLMGNDEDTGKTVGYDLDVSIR